MLNILNTFLGLVFRKQTLVVVLAIVLLSIPWYISTHGRVSILQNSWDSGTLEKIDETGKILKESTLKKSGTSILGTGAYKITLFKHQRQYSQLISVGRLLKKTSVSLDNNPGYSGEKLAEDVEVLQIIDSGKVFSASTAVGQSDRIAEHSLTNTYPPYRTSYTTKFTFEKIMASTGRSFVGVVSVGENSGQKLIEYNPSTSEVSTILGQSELGASTAYPKLFQQQDVGFGTAYVAARGDLSSSWYINTVGEKITRTKFSLDKIADSPQQDLSLSKNDIVYFQGPKFVSQDIVAENPSVKNVKFQGTWNISIISKNTLKKTTSYTFKDMPVVSNIIASPDSKKVLLLSDRTVYLLDLTTRKLTVLPDVPADKGSLYWIDNQSFAYPDVTLGIYKFNTSNGSYSPVFTSQKFRGSGVSVINGSFYALMSSESPSAYEGRSPYLFKLSFDTPANLALQDALPHSGKQFFTDWVGSKPTVFTDVSIGGNIEGNNTGSLDAATQEAKKYIASKNLKFSDFVYLP